MTQHDEIIEEPISVRVDRGFDFLTERLGPGWWDAVDLDTLDLGDCTVCVLGQLAPALGATCHWRLPEYSDVLDMLGWRMGDSEDHGFGDWHWNFGALTDEWVTRILRARGEQPVVTVTRELVAA